jgi:hypothetical protein
MCSSLLWHWLEGLGRWGSPQGGVEHEDALDRF